MSKSDMKTIQCQMKHVNERDRQTDREKGVIPSGYQNSYRIILRLYGDFEEAVVS